jgi:CzcA family heavy metal efflux pump
MLRGIIGSSIQFRYLVVVIAVALMAFGANQLRAMPVDVLPEFSPPFVEIQTEALGLSAEEVEQMITVPMEQDLLAGVAWIDTITSRSVPGLSSVLLFFEPGTDLFRARQMVSERMAQAAVGIPHVSKPPTMIQPQSSTSRFMIVGLSSQEVPLIQMSVLARWVIGPRLLGVPGVANVAIWGNRDRQLQVQVDPERLRAQGVSLQQVIETTGNALWVSPLTYLEASTPGTGGFIDTPNQRIGVWHVLPISSPEELAELPLKGAAGLRLADVARVVEGHQPLIGDGLINDGSSLLLVVEKLPGINTLEVTRGVEEALDALRPGMAGIDFDTGLFRPASFIELAVDNLTNTLLISALLVVIGLLLLLWGWRTALISAAAILVSLMAALFVLYLRGATINTMVLTGLAIALGVLIDDAIVDVDNITRHLRQRRLEGKDRSAASIVLHSTLETRSALFFATLILLLAVIPLFFLSGVGGAFFQPLTISYTLAVLASMLAAMVVTPALSVILLSGASSRGSGFPLLTRLQGGYDRVLKGIVKSKIVPSLGFIATVLVIIAAGLAASSNLGQQSLLPTFQEPYLLIDLESTPGTSQPEMGRVVARASQELRGIPGVRNVGAHVGRAVFGDQVVGINSAQIWISIDPAADNIATLAAIQETMNGYPGLKQEVTSNLQQILRGTLPGASGGQAGEDVTVRIYGENHQALRGLADQVRQKISAVEGVADLQVKLPVEEPTLQIRVDLAAAQRYGIKPGDVRRAASTLLSGIQVGSLFEEQKIFDVVVWGTPAIRRNLTDVRELLIETPAGGHVRLEEVADIQIAPAPAIIQRSGISPYLDVAFNVSGRNSNAVIGDVRAALREIDYPLEYHTEVLADFAERQTAQRSLLTAALVAVIGIFLLLHAVSGNWRLAFLTLLALPGALAGGVLTMILISGGLITLGMLGGLLTVFGIAVRNGVLLIRRCQQLEDEEGELFGPDLVLHGARERMIPVLTTALITALAFLPMLFTGSVAGTEILHPMSITILGGLVTSTLFNLFVIPALYLLFGASHEVALDLHLTEPGDVVAGDAVSGD